MSIKTILATAFAMFMMVNVSTAMASNNEENNNSEDTSKTAAPTVCKCGVATQTELENKRDEADKKAEKADKDAKDADQHYEDVKDSEDVSQEDKDQAKSDKDTKDEDKKTADEEKKKADKDAKDEEDTNASTYGACVCPNGVSSYNVPAGAASSTSSASTSAFREVRGQ